MWQHARESPRLECAGALFGSPFAQPETLESSGVPVTFVIVAVAIPYATPEQAQGHVRVTAEALAAADAYVAREHAGLRPVGWYHTHPGHGIFLSGYDYVITRSIFNAAWHVAVVLDPLRNEMGLFRGAEGERLPGYRVLRELPIELALMQLYNQGRDLMDVGRLPEALRRFQELETLFQEKRPLLTFWRDKPVYRDMDQHRRQLEIALQNSGYVLSTPSTLNGPDVPQEQAKISRTDISQDETRGTVERKATPRPVHQRVADRTLETAERVTSLPGRFFGGAKSVLSKLLHRKGSANG